MKTTDLLATAVDGKITIYKAMAYRWESEETADPIIDDESYHLDKDEAIKAADNIDLDLGFWAQVDSIVIDVANIDTDIEDYELKELDDYNSYWGDYDTIYCTDTNTGADFEPDSIIVTYRHHRYMGYAYNITDVQETRYTRIKNEADLVNFHDSTSASYHVHFNDIDELAEAFETGRCVPFQKTNSGNSIVRAFLEKNKHPDYYTEEVEEEQE